MPATELAHLPPNEPPTTATHVHSLSIPAHPNGDYYPEASSLESISNAPVLLNVENNFTPVRYVSRTPSPTPSEAAFLSRSGVLDWDRMKDWRFWFRREWLWHYIIFIIIYAIAILVGVEHTTIVRWIEPVAKNMKKLPANWLIPIAIFFVISFPPLFGHEIIALLCGIVYGLWVGFAITAAGTLLGELGNFYAFRYCCRARGEKLERKKLLYACLAKLVRDGGFRIVLIMRYSAIPGHFTTAVFSTCGVGIISFTIAAILSLPKQLAVVYLGVVFDESGSGTETKKQKSISAAIIVVTVIITWIAMQYVLYQLAFVKEDVVYGRRKSRQEKLERASSPNIPLAIGLHDPEADPSVNTSIQLPIPRRIFVD